MPNEAALKFLNDKINGLEAIEQELEQLRERTPDLDQKDRIRAEAASIGEILFALESARNSLAATANEVPPPPAARIQKLRDALNRLDKFVIGDQNVQMGLNLLTQLASAIRAS